MTDEPLQIIIFMSAQDSCRILQLKGPLNIHTIFQFHDAVRKEPPPALILDFSDVPYMDSAGLGALVAANVAGQKAARKLALVGLNTQVRALLEMTHVAQLFQVFPTVHEAEVALSTKA
ncbi:MAG: STAS domain-containing protein [Candidatus Acidiferrales bacterium]